jgi:hypothetical protein
MFDYYNDKLGKRCLKLAQNCKSDIGFGAVLVKNGRVIGEGWNRWATDYDRSKMRYVDYAIHAEQACILNAMDKGFKPSGGQVYVLGIALKGKNKGKLTTREEKVFICKKCPHTLETFGVTVNIPHVSGWMNMTPDEAMITGKKFFGQGFWNNFVTA